MTATEHCSPKKEKPEVCLAPCPIERAMRLLGGKWTGSILWHLKDGPLRFNDLSRQMGAASKNMINERLKQMEKNKLVSRSVISERPLAVSYDITEFGKTALGFLGEIEQWARENEI